MARGVKYRIDAEDRTKAAFASATRGVMALKASFGSLMGPLALLSGAAGMGGLVFSAAKAGDRFEKMAARTGVASETLSALGYVADRTGSSIDAVEKSMRYLTNQMLDVSRGSGESRQTFEDLGISVENADGSLRSVEAVLMDAADRIAGMTDETKQAAAAMEIFGSRSGQELVPMLRAGSEGIRELMERADKLGVTIGTDNAQAAAEFTDALTDLKGVAAGLGRTVAFAVMPQITDLMERAAGWAAENREVIATKLDEFLEDVGGFLNEIGAHEETFSSVFGAAVWAAEKTLALAGALKDMVSWTKEIMAGGLYGGEGLAGTYGTVGNMGLDKETQNRIINRNRSTSTPVVPPIFFGGNEVAPTVAPLPPDVAPSPSPEVVPRGSGWVNSSYMEGAMLSLSKEDYSAQYRDEIGDPRAAALEGVVQDTEDTWKTFNMQVRSDWKRTISDMIKGTEDFKQSTLNMVTSVTGALEDKLADRMADKLFSIVENRIGWLG